MHLGYHNLQQSDEQTIKLRSKKIDVHPNYNSKNNNNDIAVITLIKPVKFTNAIKPVCLPKEVEDYSGKQATIAGWGTMSEGI